MTMSFTVQYTLGEKVLLLLLKRVMRLVMKLQYAGSRAAEQELFGACN